MVPTYWMTALVLVNERSRDAQLAADHHRLVREAREAAAGRPRRPHPVRALVAGLVRWLSDATHAVSVAACSAASRIEGRPASVR